RLACVWIQDRAHLETQAATERATKANGVTMQAEQFSLRRMLTAVSIVAVGLALFDYIRPTDRGLADEFLGCIASAAIGCGIGTMYRHPVLGAVVGFCFVAMVLFVTML
ncbi:MAG TPA: hypothetical protein VFV87_10710, partial [Pirellulaceae bacterium]|nr:hypothetical protein [Pirellulaceae bacterium]